MSGIFYLELSSLTKNDSYVFDKIEFGNTSKYLKEL